MQTEMKVLSRQKSRLSKKSLFYEEISRFYRCKSTLYPEFFYRFFSVFYRDKSLKNGKNISYVPYTLR